MQADRSYLDKGHVHLRQLIAPQVAAALLQQIKRDMGDAPIPLSGVDQYPSLLVRPAFEIYSHIYPPLQAFLLGLTPQMCELTGLHLLPTYCYFRLYREGDRCRVHSDRQSCEHSLSLTLDYSDGEPWSLEMGAERLAAPSAQVGEDFGGAAFSGVEMEVGDAVLYQGVHFRHGRISPNPNEWSAHLFLHWVERDGPYGEFAFDRQGAPEPVDFRFA